MRKNLHDYKHCTPTGFCAICTNRNYRPDARSVRTVHSFKNILLGCFWQTRRFALGFHS